MVKSFENNAELVSTTIPSISDNTLVTLRGELIKAFAQSEK